MGNEHTKEFNKSSSVLEGPDRIQPDVTAASNTIEWVRRELADNADEKTEISGKRFFKEEVKSYGVKASVVSKISKQTFKSIEKLPKKEIFNLCEQLWASGMLEESFVACNWSYAVNEQYTEDDFFVFERWVNTYVSNWASCDTFCNHTVGTFLEKYPSYVEKLKEWANSQNRWVRRASAVSFIIPAKKGLFKKDIFEIADKLLLDTGDLVQKGYGWMLKSLGTEYEEDVYQYVLDKRDIMPRTSLRYAIEKMPKEKRQEAMKKGKEIDFRKTMLKDENCMNKIKELIDALYDKDNKFAYGCLKQLGAESRKSNILYPYFNIFVQMLGDSNSYIRARGLALISANAKWGY